METHIEVTMYGDLYRGYSVRRFILRVQCMETHIEGIMYGDSYIGTMYGDSYIGYNLWRFI